MLRQFTPPHSLSHFPYRTRARWLQWCTHEYLDTVGWKWSWPEWKIWAGEMAQWAKHSPHGHEGPNSLPRTHAQLGTVCNTCVPPARFGVQAGDPQTLRDQQYAAANKRSCLKQDGRWVLIPEVVLWPPHFMLGMSRTRSHTQTHAHSPKGKALTV